MLKGRPGIHFTWHDFIKSGTASRLHLDNTPTVEAVKNIRLLVNHVLDPLVEKLGRPVIITSGFRSPEVNVNLPRQGSKDSQHMKGQAADIFVTGLSAEQLAVAIASLNIPFDQLIWYDKALGGQVHISFNLLHNRHDMRHSAVGRGYLPWSPRVA